MEELLIVILQFLFETVLEALVYLPFDFAQDSLLESKSPAVGRRHVPLIIAGVGGALLGGISLVVWPHTWLHSPLLRIGNALLAPLISAGSAWLITSHRPRHRTRTSPREHAWFGFTFTLFFVSVRFAWAAR